MYAEVARDGRHVLINEVDRARAKLEAAITNGRSHASCLQLWSEFVRVRDGRCLNCDSMMAIQAHHVFRKVVHPSGSLESGNGITLCLRCHKEIHSTFNRRPIPGTPLNAQGGDDQDEMSFLFGLLMDDANARRMDHNRYYYISDEMLQMFVKYQGYAEYFESMQRGNISRLRAAHEIWRGMPDEWYRNIASDFGEILLHSWLDKA